MRFRALALDASAIAIAIAVRFAPLSPQTVERRYSNGAYPPIDTAVRAITGPVPFSIGDWLLVVAIVWLAGYWIVALTRRRAGAAATVASVALRTIAVLAAIYVWFEASWAFNYQRVPLAAKIVTHDERTNEDSVAALADRVVDELSRLAPAAHAEAPADEATIARRIEPRFEATIGRLGDVATFAPPRVKPTIFGRFMVLSGTSGFTDPWTHEVNLDPLATRFERPAIYSHEWGHVAGFADEAEANYISVIACTTSRDPLVRYSGWILVWFNLPSNVKVTHPLSRLAYDDIEAIRARYVRNVNPTVASAQRAAYDGYLKSNHVKAGYASYQLFVRWLIGADYDRGGLPIVRAMPGRSAGSESNFSPAPRS